MNRHVTKVIDTLDALAATTTQEQAWEVVKMVVMGAEQNPPGLCSIVEQLMVRAGIYTIRRVDDVIGRATQDWEHFSGVPSFPVPHVGERPDTYPGWVHDLNVAAYMFGKRWDNTEYGNLRRDLARTWADALREEFGEE